VLTAVLVGACSGSSGSNAPSASSAGAPASPSPVASKPADVVVGGDRPVSVPVPATYDAATPAPLLVVLHGYGSSGSEHEAYFHLDEAAQGRGFLTAYPDGTKDANGNRFWSATDACCDFDRTGVNDVAYLAGLITEIQSKLSVDPKRIYVTGHSNGGFMSYRMACVHADVIAAIVSLAGATFANPADCAPSAPLGVLEIHGTADDVIAYTGGTIQGLGSGRAMSNYPGAETTAATWATYDKCEPTPTKVDEHVDVDAGLEAAESTVTRWTACQPGSGVELWTIPGGGHAPDLSDAFPGAVLDFLEAHPKP